jgi:hypothetical protein
MPHRRSITSDLYRAARLSNDLETLSSGDPKRVARRARNIAKGSLLAKAGFWRWLWR